MTTVVGRYVFCFTEYDLAVFMANEQKINFLSFFFAILRCQYMNNDGVEEHTDANVVA